MSVRAAIVGAAGYAGAELTRLVAEHPEFDLLVVTSASDAGKAVSDVYPALAAVDLTYQEPDVRTIAESVDLAFLAVPHTAGMGMAPALLEAGVKVVDLSADFRLKDAEVYQRWYGVEHSAKEILAEAVYGLPELSRQSLPGARLVACPGCYPTASVLAAMPAIEQGLAKPAKVVVDAKSGVSGAGRSATAATHFVAVDESVAAYKVASHRHTPEIAGVLDALYGRSVPLVFTPHLVPMDRGLLATVYLEAADGVTHGDLQSAYESRYGEEPFVNVRKAGGLPATKDIIGTNRADVAVTLDEATRTIVAVCVIDNLLKGASGQALQCANALFGLDETTGLSAMGPVI